MKMSAGWNRKDDFGAAGANIMFTIEVPDELFLDPGQHKHLMDQARALTVMARDAVNLEVTLEMSRHREAKRKQAEEAAARHDASVAAQQNGHRPTGPPAQQNGQMVEGHWNGQEIEYGDPPDNVGPGDRGYQDPPSNGQQQLRITPAQSPPPSNGQWAAPSNGQQGAPPSGRSSGGGAVQWGPQGIPRSGFTLAGGMKNQPKDVKDRVWRLMMAAGRNAQGWIHEHEGKMQPVMFKALDDGQVSWLTEALKKPESRSHAEPALDGNGNGSS